MAWIRKLARQDDAATAVEYAVMLAMILMAAFIAIKGFGEKASDVFDSTKTEMENHGIK